MDLYWRTFIVMGFVIAEFMQHAQNVVALQCYSCENCVEGKELEVLKICGELPIEPTTPAATTSLETSSTQSSVSTTTVRVTTTTKKNDDSEEDDSDDEDDSDEDRRRDRDDIRTVTFAETTETPFATSATNAIIGDDDDEYEDLLERKANRVSSKQMVPICYMTKFIVNGTQVINLGCTASINGNKNATCQSLLQNGNIADNCEVCSSNGCNRDFLNSSGNDDDYPGWGWPNAGSKLNGQIFLIILAVLVFKFLL